MLFLGALGAGCFNSKQCQAQLNTARQHGPVLLCRHSQQDLASAQQTLSWAGTGVVVLLNGSVHTKAAKRDCSGVLPGRIFEGLSLYPANY